MTARQPNPEPLLGKLARMGVVGITTAGVGSTFAHGLDGAFPDAGPIDVTGLHGAQIDSGSIMHHGPADGGDLLDRPSAGYMAHSSSTNGIELQHDGEVTTIARHMDKAGTFNVDGNEISVLDYIPGGDMVQMAAGNIDPSQIMMTIAQHGIQNQMSHDTVGTPGRTRTEVGAADVAESNDGSSINAEEGRVDRIGRKVDADGQHIPDADENARDMEALALQHRIDLDTAVETSDQYRVHTEIHAHGRTLVIDTDFEATAKDNSFERAEAAEHVEEVAHAPVGEMEHSRPDMHFRSKVQAHLDAAAQDEGMSI